MQKGLIGREKEKLILLRALRSNEAEIVAVIGRLRVGKTFLIRSVYEDYLRFETAGVQHASRKEQLKNFSKQLRKSFGESAPNTVLNTWQDAFFALRDCLEQTPDEHKK
jgi:uncharacterized protein